MIVHQRLFTIRNLTHKIFPYDIFLCERTHTDDDAFYLKVCRLLADIKNTRCSTV